jgi:flagellar hook-associated protein 1 FlgK
MSITTSLSNALTGLTAASRAAEIVSNNVSNAMTEGYGRREIVLGARTLGGLGSGVRVEGVLRDVDAAVIRDRRLADAALGGRLLTSAFLDRLGSLVGTPEDASSVTGRLAALESALTSAASRPDSEVRLRNVLDSATALARTVKGVSDGIQAERAAADADIARQVDTLNRGLEEVRDLNAQILRLGSASRDASALADQRQRAIDQIAAIVPLREFQRDNGTVALYTTTGAALLDGRAATIGFTRTPTITPDMTLASGALSGLTIDTKPVRTEGAFAPFAGGSLAAAFTIRDDLAITAQARVDGLAREIVTRFQDPAVDPTVAPGAAGLFTDGTAAFVPANEAGLAARLGVNALADPARGGDLWRLRSGLGAAAPGPAGDAALLTSLASATFAVRAPATAALPATGVSLAGLAAELQSLTSRDGLTAETELGFATARQETLAALEKRGGVDTDQEMQKLLLIEQIYAANARVITTIDSLINRLLEI